MTEQYQKQLGAILGEGGDHFRGVTKLIAHGKQRASDHFRGATKMVVHGKVRQAVCVVGIRRFSTQCEENLNEVPA